MLNHITEATQILTTDFSTTNNNTISNTNMKEEESKKMEKTQSRMEKEKEKEKEAKGKEREKLLQSVYNIKKAKERQREQIIKKKRKQILINSIKYLTLNKITVEEYLTKNPLPSRPFELINTEEFFRAVKFNNYDLVNQALDKDVHYIDQIDYFKQTAFHWAAKLGSDKMLKLLFHYSERCNIFDRKRRTPLYLAALNNHKKCVEILLQHGANPGLPDKNGKKPENVTNDLSIKVMLQTTNVYDKDFFEFQLNKRKKSDNIFNKLDKKDKDKEKDTDKDKNKDKSIDDDNQD